MLLLLLSTSARRRHGGRPARPRHHPTDGLALIQITSAVTSQAGRQRYKIVVTDAQGRPSTLRWGPLEIVST